jgi:Rrf2 family protein
MTSTADAFDLTVAAVDAPTWLGVHITPRSDLAVRFLLLLAAQPSPTRPVRSETIAVHHGVPTAYAMGVLLDLRRRGLVTSQRGTRGGFRLTRPPEAISVGDIVRAIDGAASEPVGGNDGADGAGAHLTSVWATVQSSVWTLIDGLSLRDVVDGRVTP